MFVYVVDKYACDSKIDRNFDVAVNLMTSQLSREATSVVRAGREVLVSNQVCLRLDAHTRLDQSCWKSRTLESG